jgi:hypothetical protein
MISLFPSTLYPSSIVLFLSAGSFSIFWPFPSPISTPFHPPFSLDLFQSHFLLASQRKEVV